MGKELGTRVDQAGEAEGQFAQMVDLDRDLWAGYSLKEQSLEILMSRNQQALSSPYQHGLGISGVAQISIAKDWKSWSIILKPEPSALMRSRLHIGQEQLLINCREKFCLKKRAWSNFVGARQAAVAGETCRV